MQQVRRVLGGVRRRVAAQQQGRALERRRAQDPVLFAVAERVRAERLTFLDLPALLDLGETLQRLQRDGVPGAVVEAGCALGGSAIVLAGVKERERPMSVHDVFGMIPPPTERDGADVLNRYATIAAGQAEGFEGDTYYGYQEDLRSTVAASFDRLGVPTSEHAVELVEGLFEDTLHPDGPVALGHVDGDWYESVKVCLERLWPVLSPSGVLVIDDYLAWSGCRTAVDEFFAGRTDFVVEHRSRPHYVKRTPA